MYKVCIEECGWADHIDDKLDEPEDITLCPYCGSYVLEYTDSFFLNKKAGLHDSNGLYRPDDEVDD